jgi:hypothetical protein
MVSTYAQAKGREGKPSNRDKKFRSPPKDEPWVWLPRSLIESDAWRLKGINCARIMDRLLAEHMAHGGQENGALKATYEQLMEWGLTRRHITNAIAEAEFLGLVRKERGGFFSGRSEPNLYRLTFYADIEGNPATNEWKSVSEEAIKAWRKQRSRNQRNKANSKDELKNNSLGHNSPLDQAPLRVVEGGKCDKS